MACSTNQQTILNGIVSDITDILITSGEYTQQGNVIVRTVKNNITRLPSSAEQGRTELIEEATNELKGLEGIDQEDPDTIQAQQEKLTLWATENKKLLDVEDLGEQIGAGEESQVYRQGDRVYKVMGDIYSPSPLSMLDRLAINNTVVPDNVPTRLEGYTIVDNQLKTVVSQPYIDGTPLEDRDSVITFMERNGWIYEGGDDYSTDEYIIKDLRPENILVDDIGNFHLIDVVSELNTPEADYGGQQGYLPISNNSILQSINDLFPENVVSEKDDIVNINIPQSVLDQYTESEEANLEAQGIIANALQIENPSVSPPQRMKVMNLLNDLGVEIDNMTLAGQPTTVDAIAIPLQALVGHTEGREDALSEEAFHVALEILEINHPGLLNKMLSSIASLPIYNETLQQYGSNAQYQKNGKTDIRKIKKEAIAKQLATQFDQSPVVTTWWQRVKEYLQGLFSRSNVNLAPFKDALDIITRGNISTVRNTLLKSQKYLESKDISPENANEIIRLANSALTDQELRYHIEQLVPTEVFYSLSTSTNHSYTKLQVKNPIPDTLSLVGDRLTELFGSNTSKPFKELMDKFRGQKDTNARKDIDNILTRYITPTGDIRQQPFIFTTSNMSREDYDKLELLITEQLGRFPDSKFMINEKGADLLIIDNKGVANIINFFVTDKESVNYEEREGLTIIQDTISKDLKDQYKVNVGQNRTILIPVQKDTIVDTEATKALINRADRTGIAQIDILVGNLNRIKDRLSRGTMDARLFGNLTKAIHDLKTAYDVRALNKVVNTVHGQADSLIDGYENFQNSNPTTEDIADYARRMDNLKEFGSTLQDLYNAVSKMVTANPKQFEKAQGDLKLLRYTVGKLRTTLDNLNNLSEEFTEVYTANPQGESNIVMPEREVRFLTKNFNKFSDSVTKATRILYGIVSGVQNGSRIAVSQQFNKIKAIKEAYDKIADQKNYLSFIAQKSKTGKYIHKLIQKYDLAAFRKGLKEAISTQDKKWVKDHIDVKAYTVWFNSEKAKVFASIDSTTFHTDNSINEEVQQREKDGWLDKYDIDRNISEYNQALYRFMNDRNLSEDYKRLLQNKPAHDLWQYLYDINQRAYKQGLLSWNQAQEVIPSVEKNFVESLQTNGKLTFGTNVLKSLLSPEDYAAETAVNPETGMPEDKIPFYFANDIGKIKNGEQDYSNVSQDIFKILPQYLYQTEFAERMIPQEAQIRLLGLVEKNKPVRATNQFGEIGNSEGSFKSEANFEYYWNFVRMAVYGQRDLDGTSDQRIVKMSQNSVKWINKTFGTSFSEDNSAVSVTARGLIKAANKMFQLKVLGLNFAIPIANLFGSEFQAFINSGSEFTKQDLWRNQLKAIQQGWSQAEKSTFTGLADYFQVFVDGMNLERMGRQLTSSTLNKRDIPELLMSLQSESEVPLQMMIAGAMFDTFMVEDGKIVSIRNFVKDKYPDYYDKTQSERQKIDTQIEQEIKQLMDTRSLSKVASFQNGILNIPGIERQSQEVYSFINKVQAHVKRATGGGNRDDIRQINGTMLGSSLMVFKSWMPRLIQNRISGLRYSKGLGTYEMGRYTAVGKALSGKWTSAISTLYNIYSMNDKGVQRLREVYERHKQEYETRTGEPLNMSQRDYFDMYQRLVHNATKDALFFAGLLGVWAAMGAMRPPEEDDGSAYNLVYNLTERFQKEMSFYYNPGEIYNVFNGSLFPALGIVRDFTNATKDLSKTIGYGAMNLAGYDKEAEFEKVKLFKSISRPIPILNQAGIIMQIFFEEQAKEMGYKDLTPTDK